MGKKKTVGMTWREKMVFVTIPQCLVVGESFKQQDVLSSKNGAPLLSKISKKKREKIKRKRREKMVFISNQQGEKLKMYKK